MNKTIFNSAPTKEDWRMAKNHCRTTDNKDFTEKDPSVEFKRKLLISEHSPIRRLMWDWTWKDIPYWVSTEWSRHKFEKFISTQRDDRLIDDIPRGKKPQDALVRYDGWGNMQNLIDSWRKRLCFKATKEARELAEDFKYELSNSYPVEAMTLVPNCIYRCGCPEFESCGYFKKFKEYYEQTPRPEAYDLFDIWSRYVVYNTMFYRDYVTNHQEDL